MGYAISQDTGECVKLPAVVLDRLTQATEGAVRTALYILKKGRADKEEVCEALGLTPAEAESALVFWLGAGLLEKDDQPKKELPKRPPRLSQREIVAASQNCPEVAILMEECQNLFGEVLAPADSAILASLYLSDGLPVDLILTGVSHFVQEGKRNVRYIERRLLAWQREGICTCEAAERYLRLLARRREHEIFVAAMLELSPEAFTAAEKKRIAVWYEDFGYGDEMVEQGALRCGVNRSVKYLNGILRNWHGKGIHTPSDIRDEGANIAAITSQDLSDDDFVAQKRYTVPKYKKGGAE